MRQRMVGKQLLFTVTALALAVGPGGAQQLSVTIRARVTDSLGVPVSGAEVSIVDGLSVSIARGTTDARGALALAIPRTGIDHELVVRRIGYRRVDRFFNDSSSDLVFEVRLQRLVASLDTVRVTAEEDVRRKSYFIDADAIEQSSRPIVDALDVVMKLRPELIWSRTGKPDRIGQHAQGRLPSARTAMQQAAKWGNCPPVQDVWVNGVRMRLIPIDPVAVRRRSGDAEAISPTIATVLASIKPEHIAEMEYHPCTDHADDLPARASNALFVTLKPGIGFLPVTGSYVVAANAPPVIHADASLPPAGNWRLRIEKTGYDTLSLPLTVSLHDSVPLTVVLSRHKGP
jgi:hypothetical protein